ncbi:DNA-directed RNA polymerases I and III subunit RPAC1-like [Uloborus diversus]|uniref:DNA-directed RNA polymerases I and III subunit RPAC1-like n=1 Tax=Uloborus diversus TaxID=327109 RepID=UPI002409D595|nr:DNA-directed RNA polymerases I and III subunit RPAC1-like [Uloborus diversus]
MASVDETVYKLKEFGILNEGASEARYDAKTQTLDDLKENLKMKIIEIDKEKYEMEFDIIGIGAPIANAIRRILIAEIPTMAIDKIHMFNNTAVIPDEVLTHRIGMVPIKVDPRLFEYKDSTEDPEKGTEEDTIQFELKVKCSRKPNIPKDSSVPDDKAFNHAKVYSRDLKFVPINDNQKKMYGNIRPVHEDILLAVMKPGHEIDLKAFCYKNVGREHAKFSPVVVASYRLLPRLKLLEEISGERAHLLSSCFSPGVIRISHKKGKEVAKVADSRKINCSRNVLLHDELSDAVEISKVKDHYIFTVESAGALQPEVLVQDAINILKSKCRNFLSEIKSLKM